jgi:hypothetical protein
MEAYIRLKLATARETRTIVQNHDPTHALEALPRYANKQTKSSAGKSAAIAGQSRTAIGIARSAAAPAIARIGRAVPLIAD